MTGLSELMESLVVMLLLVLMEVKMLGGDGGFPSGYCQVYSYNINHRGTSVSKKHFFVCCNNMDEKACQGFTYQKPSRSESFCTGQVIQQEGSHWTQMETAIFPDNGRFYCGGCCGQHLAMDTCNQEMSSARKGCTNWVQCYKKQCQSILAAVLANKPLKCSVPPPPHPKHYRQELHILPSNLTSNTKTSKAEVSDNSTCTKEWCTNLEMNIRCRHSCCEDFCCLLDGNQGYLSQTLLWGLTTVQIIGIIIGSLAMLASFVGILLLVVQRCNSPCNKRDKVPTSDTQILVIEGPEEVETDPEESA